MHAVHSTRKWPKANDGLNHSGLVLASISAFGSSRFSQLRAIRADGAIWRRRTRAPVCPANRQRSRALARFDDD